MHILVSLKKVISVRFAMMARLTEEMGELAREVNHYYGEKPKKTTEKKEVLKKSLEMYYLL